MSRDRPGGGTGAGEPSAGVDQVWGWPWGRWMLAVCLVHVLAGLVLYDPTLFTGGDNAGYMILGEALRTGEGYRDLYLPDAPVHTKYPPFYPALLAVLGWIGGLQLFKLASLALTTGAVWLTAAAGRRWAGPRTGLLAAFVLALNPVLLDYSHWVLSEAPFVFLVLLALWAAGREEAARAAGDESAARRWLAGSLAAAAGAFLTRTAGLPLLAAFVLRPLFRRRGVAAVTAIAVAVGAAGGWALFQRLGAPEQAGYLQELLMVNPYDPAAGTVGAAGLLERTARNFWRYVTEVLPGAVTGGEGRGVVASLFGLALASVALAGWLRRSLDELGAAEVFLFLYVATISAWPSVWTDARFLLPVLPLLFLYGLHGAAWAGARVAAGLGDDGAASSGAPDGDRPAGGRGAADGAGPIGRRPRSATLAAGLAAAVLLVPELLSALETAPARLRCLGAYRAGSPCAAPGFGSFFSAARWARENSSPDAVFVNRKPRLFYWVGRRRGDVYPYSSEPDVVMAKLEELGAEYVVVDAVSGTTARYLVPAVEAHRLRFEVVYREGNPPTWILAYRPPPTTAGAGRPGVSGGPEAPGGSGAAPGPSTAAPP